MMVRIIALLSTYTFMTASPFVIFSACSMVISLC